MNPSVNLYLVRPGQLYGSNQNMVEPQQPTPNRECLLLYLISESFPSPRGGTVMYKTPSARYGYQSAIRAQSRVSYRPVRCEIALRDLDALPDVGFGVNNAHIWLICAAVYQNAVIHLKERILSVVLRVN
jgi:hypothetical protein